MIRLTLIFVFLAAGLLVDDGEDEGRRGNELYERGSYDIAAETYLRGLESLDDGSPLWVQYALHNNLGAALLNSGDASAAGDAFDRALEGAPTPDDFARSAYNAGNAAFEADDLSRALAYYRESLLRDPTNLDAKYNYEFVKRRLQEEQQQQQQQQQQQNGDEQEQNQDQSGEGQGEQEQEQQQQSNQENPQQGDSEQREGDQPDQPRPDQSSQQPQDGGEQLSREQAQRILQALQNEEEQLLREVQRRDVRPRRVEKDW